MITLTSMFFHISEVVVCNNTGVVIMMPLTTMNECTILKYMCSAHQYIYELQYQKARVCHIHPWARYSNINYAQIHPKNLCNVCSTYMWHFKCHDYLVVVSLGSMFWSNTIIMSLQCRQNKVIKIANYNLLIKIVEYCKTWTYSDSIYCCDVVLLHRAT